MVFTGRRWALCRAVGGASLCRVLVVSLELWEEPQAMSGGGAAPIQSGVMWVEALYLSVSRLVFQLSVSLFISLPVYPSSCLLTLSACMSLSTVSGSAHLIVRPHLSEDVPHVFDWLTVAAPQRLIVAIEPPPHCRRLLAGQRGEQSLCAGRRVLFEEGGASHQGGQPGISQPRLLLCGRQKK